MDKLVAFRQHPSPTPRYEEIHHFNINVKREGRAQHKTLEKFERITCSGTSMRPRHICKRASVFLNHSRSTFTSTSSGFSSSFGSDKLLSLAFGLSKNLETFELVNLASGSWERILSNNSSDFRNRM